MILQTMALLAALQGLAAAANDRRLLSQVDSSVMTINLPAKGNWKIGTTLDSFFDSGSPTPFTDDSITAFEEAWNSKEFETAGSFTMTADILSSMDEKIDMLNIKGELSVSFAMFSGDAHMSFLNENVQSETDVSVMVKASSTGKKKQMDLSQTNILELKDSTIDELEEFEKMYGAYLIVGYIYGGEIIFESIYSANNQKDKTKVEGGLAASFNQGGFEISGSADVGYESSDTLSEVSSNTKWSMRPNVNAADETAVNDLISTLSALARGDASDDNTLHEKLSLSAQDILSKDFVDPIQAIVVPLRSVSAVHEKFLDNPDAADTVAFMEYLNEMYLEVTARLMQIDMVTEQWSSQASEEYPVPWSTLGQWEFQLQHFKTEMSMLRNMEDIIDKSQEWHATTRSWNADVLAATSFIEIPAVTTGINYQFEQAIMGPYEKMLAAETTTPAPKTPAPAPKVECPDNSVCLCETTAGLNKQVVGTVDLGSDLHFEMDFYLHTSGASIWNCVNGANQRFPSVQVSNGELWVTFGLHPENIVYMANAANVFPSINEWHHLELKIWDQNGFQLKLDGQLKNSGLTKKNVDWNAFYDKAAYSKLQCWVSTITASVKNIVWTSRANADKARAFCDADICQRAALPAIPFDSYPISDPFHSNPPSDPFDPLVPSDSYWFGLNYNNLLMVLCGALVVLCGLNLHASVQRKQRPRYAAVKTVFDSDIDVEATPINN